MTTLSNTTNQLGATYIASAVTLASQVDAQNTNWLSDYRNSQCELLANSEFPHRQVEHFKYNRLHAFTEQNFAQLVSVNQKQSADDFAIAGFTEKSAKVVFVNGVLDASQSDFKGHDITSFADVNEVQQQQIVGLLADDCVKQNPFSLVNASLTQHGVFINLDENSPKIAIDIVNITDFNAQNCTLANQVVVNVADRCVGTVVTRNVSIDETRVINALSTQRFVANIGESATFNHYHLPFENIHSLHFASVSYVLHSHTQLNAFHALTGGNLKKADVKATHKGQHALAKINGLYVASGDQQVDYHTCVNHPYANGTTDENFRGIVNGNAEATFNGRIQIFEDAQKTLAELSNKNLLLSDTSLLHTKPELEIYADDVICAHGATVSRLQDSALNYLRARGVSKQEAEKMLSYAFFDELLAEIEIEEIADYIRPQLFQHFS